MSKSGASSVGPHRSGHRRGGVIYWGRMEIVDGRGRRTVKTFQGRDMGDNVSKEDDDAIDVEARDADGS